MANHWTPERRAKQAEAIRAWQPWKRATGPRTVKGKAKASRNAYAGAVRLKLRELGRALRELEAGFLSGPHVTGPSQHVRTRGETSAGKRESRLLIKVNAQPICVRREGH